MFEQINASHALALFFVANALYFASYLVRDILWLRVIAVVAALTTVPYFYLRPEPMYSALFWQGAFLLTNLVHATVLIFERRPVQLTEDQLRLHTLVFPLFTRRQMLRVLDAGEWREADAGQRLISRGEIGAHLILVFKGALEVRAGDRIRARLEDGQFAGEMSLLSGRRTSADAVTTEPTRYIAWDVTRLDRLWQRHPGLRGLFESTLSLDLVHKLAGTDIEVPDT